MGLLDGACPACRIVQLLHLWCRLRLMCSTIYCSAIRYQILRRNVSTKQNRCDSKSESHRGDVQGLGTRRSGYQRQGGRAARSSMVHAVTALVRLFLQGTAFDIANKGSNRADHQASQHTIPEHWCAELSCSTLLTHHLTLQLQQCRR